VAEAVTTREVFPVSADSRMLEMILSELKAIRKALEK
jgi:hypothetical protein